MVYRKAVYQVINGEMTQETAENLDEFHSFLKDGWHDHPEFARNAVVCSVVAEVVSVNKKPLSQMNKTDLAAHALTVHGVTLDTTTTKKIMLAEFKELIA